MATSTPGPRLLEGFALLSAIADELVLRTVRDTHRAFADRVHGALGVPTRRISPGVYGVLGTVLRGSAAGLSLLADRGVGPGLEDTSAGRFAAASVNGLIGDRLALERPRLAVPLACRRHGRDVPLARGSLAQAYPAATGSVAVLLHGLCESDTAWGAHRERVGTTYPDTLTELGWTPVLLRANTGAGVWANGAALSGLLRDLVDAWPTGVERLALVGHSLGGLLIRAACAVATDAHPPWSGLVTDVVTLGTPHLGAPLAGGVGRGARALRRMPETAAFGRILDQRSAGVRDLVAGLDLPPLPGARYHLVSATFGRSPRNPVGRIAGDLLVTKASAFGHGPGGTSLFPGADELHLPGTGHLDLLNHPRVHDALRTWLGRAQGAESAVREQRPTSRGSVRRSG